LASGATRCRYQATGHRASQLRSVECQPKSSPCSSPCITTKRPRKHSTNQQGIVRTRNIFKPTINGNCPIKSSLPFTLLAIDLENVNSSILVSQPFYHIWERSSVGHAIFLRNDGTVNFIVSAFHGPLVVMNVL
jgi:hypothetical protein